MPLFPYINAVADQAQFYEKPVYIKFLLFDRLCAFYPKQGAFTPVQDIADAMVFLPQLRDFIVDVYRPSSGIIPSHKKFKPASALGIYRLLPGSPRARISDDLAPAHMAGMDVLNDHGFICLLYPLICPSI